MELVEDTLDVPLDDFLERPLFAFLAQASPGGPRVSPLWFHWEDRTVWHVALSDRSYLQRARADPRSALAVVDFDPAAGRVQHVGMRGQASVEPFDPELGRRLLARYLGPDESTWPDRFAALDPEGLELLAFEPETVVARDQSYAAPPGAPVG